MLARSVSRCALTVVLIGLAPCCSVEGDPLEFSPAELPPASVGVPYSATIAVLHNDTDIGDISVESGTLPPGIALHYTSPQNTATLAGTPEEAGLFEFTIAAWSYGNVASFQRGRKDYRLEVR